jgi:predicted dehydrogenase
MDKVRFGVVGLGAVGSSHARAIAAAGSDSFGLGGVACATPENAHRLAEQLDVPHFHNAQELFDSGTIDAVLIATPHYWHPPLAVRAARCGIHVLCEKPLAVTVGPARWMIDQCRKHNVALGVMFQQRLRPMVQRMRSLIDEGTLGDILRVEMVCSDWIRTQAYYSSGAWRGTWNGEGGGVLMNQGPHSLDLFLWLGGLPREVFAFCETRHHTIEVENTAELVCRYDGPVTGHIYASTAHAPGIERMVLSGERATAMIQDDWMKLGTLTGPLREHILTCPRAGSEEGALKCEWAEVLCEREPSADELRLAVIHAFARHLIDGSPMVADAQAGLRQVELTNAAYLASHHRAVQQLPVDPQAVEEMLRNCAEASEVGGLALRATAEDDIRTLQEND